MAAEKFRAEKLDKDLHIIAPAHKIDISFGPHKIEFGNVLTPTQVRDIPEILAWPAEHGNLYTLVMTDPDVPSRQDPQMKEWQHWIIVNIPGNDISKGLTAVEFVGSAPPPQTGLHRYTFLTFKQAGHIPENSLTKLTNRSAEGRSGFSIANFAKENDLGNPIAGNYYQAEFDEECLKWYDQLGLK